MANNRDSYPNKSAIREEIEITLRQVFFYSAHYYEAKWLGADWKDCIEFAENPFSIGEDRQRYGDMALGSFVPRRYFDFEMASPFRKIIFLYGVVNYFDVLNDPTGKEDAADRFERLVRDLVRFADWAANDQDSVAMPRKRRRPRSSKRVAQAPVKAQTRNIKLVENAAIPENKRKRAA